MPCFSSRSWSSFYQPRRDGRLSRLSWQSGPALINFVDANHYSMPPTYLYLYLYLYGCPFCVSYGRPIFRSGVVFTCERVRASARYRRWKRRLTVDRYTAWIVIVAGCNCYASAIKDNCIYVATIRWRRSLFPPFLETIGYYPRLYAISKMCVDHKPHNENTCFIMMYMYVQSL